MKEVPVGLCRALLRRLRLWKLIVHIQLLRDGWKEAGVRHGVHLRFNGKGHLCWLSEKMTAFNTDYPPLDRGSLSANSSLAAAGASSRRPAGQS